MAQFNPNVPQTNDPDYRRYSHPIDRPESDKSAVYQGEVGKFSGESAEYAGKQVGYDYQSQAASLQGEGKMLSDAGEIFGTAVRAGDAYVKKNIDDTVYDRASATRDYYTAQLQNSPLSQIGHPGQLLPQSPTNASTEGGGQRDSNTPTSGPSGAPMSLLPADAPIPTAVASASDDASTLLAARMNGKLSETDYWMRQNNLAKDLRNQYPGYKEYIDQQFEKVTGVNPANAVVKSLISDINSNLMNNRSLTQHVMNELSSSNIPNADVYWRALRDGRMDPADAVSFLNKSNFFKYKLEVMKATNETEAAGQAMSEREATNALNHIGPSIIDNYVSTVAAESGLGTTKNMGELVKKAMSGEIQITDDQAHGMMQSLQARRSAVAQAMWNSAVQAGMVERMGGADKLKKLIEDQMVPFDQIASQIGNKEWGLMYTNMNRVKAITEDTGMGMFQDKDTGLWNRVLAASNKTFGNQVSNSFMTALQSKGYNSGMYKMLADETFKNLANSPDMRTSSVPGLKPDNTPYTIGDSVDTMRKAGVAGDTPQGKQAFADITNLPLRIMDPKVPDAGKVALIRSAFDPSNIDFIGKIMDSGVDSKGRAIRGKYELFSDWTSPNMTKEIRRLDQQNPGKGLWNDYKDWAETTFGRTLFSKQIYDLKPLQDRENIQIRYHPANGDNPPQFELTKLPFGDKGLDTIHQRMLGGEIAGWNQGQDTIKGLNSGLRSMAAIAKSEGKDPDAYVLNQLVQRGFDPTAGKRPVGDIVNMLGEAVKQSRDVPVSAKPSTKGEITDKALPYNEENAPSSGVLPQGASLSDWLRQPAGVVAQNKQNAPVVNSGAPRGIPRKSINLSDDGPIMGIQTTDVPEGIDTTQMLRALKNR